jgi:hypothetical protein
MATTEAPQGNLPTAIVCKPTAIVCVGMAGEYIIILLIYAEFQKAAERLHSCNE